MFRSGTFWRRILGILLAALMLFGAAWAEPSESDPTIRITIHFYYTGSCGPNLKWRYSNHTLTISGSGRMYDYDSSAPWHRFDITKVIINNGITYLGSHAFAGEGKVPSFTLPNSLTSIGDNAFTWCKFSSITIPKSVTKIGDYAFSMCEKLKSITIPSSVTSIGVGVFTCCYGLTSFDWPESVKAIKDYTFNGCDHLKKINVPDTVTSIGQGVFQHCDRLTSFRWPKGATEIKDTTFRWCGALKTIQLHDKIKSIGNEAFQLCEKLTLTIPSSVKSIGRDALEYVKMVKVNCSMSSDVISKASQAKKHKVIHGKAVEDPAVPATCTETGLTKGTHCSVCKEPLKKQKTVKALGHKWGSPEYEWAENYKTVTAVRTCKRDEHHKEKEKVKTSALTSPATYEKEGAIYYIAEFTNKAFKAQSYKVILPKLEKDGDGKGK